MQAYSDPKRENESTALPDIEVFHISPADAPEFARNLMQEDYWPGDDYEDYVGWYWWSCFPGCLPDGDPFGPFVTSDEALSDAQEK